jgi:putative FmdB family regulatory protein
VPLYDYQCGAGHLTEKVRPMKGPHPRTVKCGSCRRRATRIYSRPAVKPDFPEHYNWSMGCVVKNRKHHERLQRERGLKDWEPRKESPMFTKLRREGYSI